MDMDFGRIDGICGYKDNKKGVSRDVPRNL